MIRRVDYEALHEMVHRNAKEAWPQVLAFIERGGGSELEGSHFIGDIAFSDALPGLIDDIERAFARSARLQKAILWSSAELGGIAGPEIDRLWKLVEEAERRHAVVREFDFLDKRPRFSFVEFWASLTGKAIIHRLRTERPSGGRRTPRRPAMMKKQEITPRTDALIESVRERLSDSEYAWAIESSGQAEWEIALAVIHDAVHEGRLVLTDAEAAELFSIGEHVDRRMLDDLISLGKSRPEPPGSADYDPVSGAPIAKDARATRRP
jgi:hypothetical protein